MVLQKIPYLSLKEIVRGARKAYDYCTNYNFRAAEFKTRNVSAKEREKYVSESSSIYELSRIFTSVAI